MKKQTFLLLAICLFCLGRTNAQGVNLRLGLNSLAGLPNVVGIDSSYIDSVQIFNDSSSAFQGLINIAADIHGDTLVGDTFSGSVLNYPTANVGETIPAHGSIIRELIINVQNPPFIVGTSGVVIWPKAFSFVNQFIAISDSVSKTVIVFPVGIDEIIRKNLKVYMSNGSLVIQDDGNYLLKNVKLYEVSGKLLQEQQISSSGTLNMNPYATGVYLAEVNFADNTRMVFKVFNVK
jgi:hypothetical protein